MEGKQASAGKLRWPKKDSAGKIIQASLAPRSVKSSVFDF